MLTMMLFLPIDVLKQRLTIRRSYGECGISALPRKSRKMRFKPLGRGRLYFADQVGQALRGGQPNGQMQMIHNTADAIALAAQIANNGRDVRIQLGPRFVAEKRASIFCAENDVNQHEAQRLGHSRNYRSRLQRSYAGLLRTWGFAPGWYSGALSALTVVPQCGVVLTLSALAFGVAGCKSAPAPAPAPSSPVVAKPAYPPRPTITPPPFRVFHTTDNSITLVTDANATDDQIEAIIWQLRDAAHNHSFDKLHIPQKLVDARDPMIWFHIYRGAKCASEKYTSGKLPCGASYHAAGDYTFGGFANPNHEDGVLIHDENHQTELWNPDTPYPAP